MGVASAIYAGAARARRRWYARHPELRRRLERPVISIGNVAAGGSGKTPLAAYVAQVLLEQGERPAILTRGYARREPSEGVTVVSDGVRLLADVERAGDEPLMLARRLPTVPVLVSADRFLAGRFAERRLGCTVHVLDDGFQHFQLERTADIVVVSADDVSRPETLPTGHLREPLETASLASAIVVPESDDAQAASIGLAVGVERVFRLVRWIERPRLLEPAGRVVTPAAGTRVLAVAGLARPEQFFAGLTADGWTVAATMAFRDHHAYTSADIGRIVATMREARAVMVITTEKDLMRLLGHRPLPVPVAWVPLQVRVEPAAEFRDWLATLMC